MKILIAEDDANTRKGLAEVFVKEGFDVVEASNGEEALALFQTRHPDIVCLDVMMPSISGYEVCRRIRRENGDVPILFISAKSEEIDAVVGLEIGGDDYIAKPFGVKEVVARIRAVARRCFAKGRASSRPESMEFRMKDLRVVFGELRAYRENGEAVELSFREVKILKCLHENKGKALTRDRIFNECWGQSYFPNSRTLDQQISQLRKRIEPDPKTPTIIKTVHGVGYRYEG